MEPTVSVIVGTRDRPSLVRTTVDSILAGSVPPGEVIVIDHSMEPDDGLRTDDRVRYVWSETRGLSRAKNVGAELARHPILAFADDDLVVAADWLRELVAALGAESDRVAVAGQVLPGAPERPGGFTPSYYIDDVAKLYSGRIDNDPLGGGNMAIYRSAFDAVGGFDERLGPGARYPAADDNDLGLRLLEAGYRIAYAPGAIVEHRAWRPPSFYPVGRWRYGRGKGGFYGKHLALDDRHIKKRLTRDVTHRLRRLPRSLVHDPRQALGDLAYTSGICAGLAQWLVSERAR